MRLGPVAASLVVVLVSARAAASELRLDWQAPEGCPTEEQVASAALQAVREPIPKELPPLEAKATVERGERWRVRLETRRGPVSGERRLEASTCGGLADATAIILALALVPPVDEREIEPPAPPPAPPTPKPIAPVVDERPSRPAPAETTRPPSLAAGASAAVQAATLPSPAIGGGLSLAWLPGRTRVEAFGSLYGAQSQTTSLSSAGARFAMTAVGVGACHALIRGRLELSPCAGAEIAIVRASGFGATTNYETGAEWTSALGSVLVALPIGRDVAVRTRLDALAPLSRPSFVVENEGPVHRPPTLGVRAWLGAELRFL